MKRKLLRAMTMTILGVAMTGQLEAEPKVGELAPAFTLKASDGRIYDLASFKGKRAVVLAWYPKAFTGG